MAKLEMNSTFTYIRICPIKRNVLYYLNVCVCAYAFMHHIIEYREHFVWSDSSREIKINFVTFVTHLLLQYWKGSSNHIVQFKNLLREEYSKYT